MLQDKLKDHSIRSYYIGKAENGNRLILENNGALNLERDNLPSIFKTFLSSLLSLFIFALALLQAWDTSDSLIPNCEPIALSFSPVCCRQRYIFRSLVKTASSENSCSISSNISDMDSLGINSLNLTPALSFQWGSGHAILLIFMGLFNGGRATLSY